MSQFTPFSALVGGALIGAAASLLLLFNGRIAGISGLVGGTLQPDSKDRVDRLLFLGGLVGTGWILSLVQPSLFPSGNAVNVVPAIIAGLLVGFGSRLGNGCTSGHGVCGLSRMSGRSMVATATFMTAAAITVYVTRHWMGGSP